MNDLPSDEILDSYPLSPMQQGILFHSLYAAQSGVYVPQNVIELHEDLHPPTFWRAWTRVLERHPILRTSFHWSGLEEPEQRVHRWVDLPFVERDLRNLRENKRREFLEAYLLEDHRRGFDPGVAPLLRLALFRVGEAEYFFVRTSHHLLMDGWSLVMLYKEVFALYEAFCQGVDLQPEQSRPFRAYLDWLKGQDLTDAQNFWRTILKGFSAPTPFMIDQVPVLEETDQGRTAPTGFERRSLRLPESLTSALKGLASANDITLNTLVQGAWALLLGRYSGEQQVVFGATRACRKSALGGADDVLGPLINTLPLRVDISPEQNLLPWLKELRAQWVGMRRYENTPVMKIQEWSDVPPGMALFESIVSYDYQTMDSIMRSQGGSWEKRVFRYTHNHSYPLSLGCFGEVELLIELSYDRGRFSQDSVESMFAHLETLLAEMVTNPHRRLGTLPMLSRVERQQVLVEWNNTMSEFPRDVCVHQLFEAQVERTPDSIAVVYQDQHLTYAELNARANQLARYLRKQGVGPEVLVGICMQRSLEMVIAILGVLKAGGAYVPLDPTYPHERLDFMLADVQAPVLLTQGRLLDYLGSVATKLICLDEDWKRIATENEANLLSAAWALNTAYMIYTSGSTGMPKGVMITHSSLVNHMHWMQQAYSFSEQDKVLQKTPFSFDASVWEFYAPLLTGGQLVMASPGGHMDIPYMMDTINQHGITVLQVVPSLLPLILEAGRLKTCSSLRYLFCGGEALPVDLPGRVFETLDAMVINLYGPAEACINTTTWTFQRGVVHRVAPIGRPIANVQIYILDKGLQPVPVGVPGELYVGGAGLGRGYHHRPELTAEKFIPNPFGEQGERLYKTGDLVRYLPDGAIDFLGRIDHQVKLRGFRIELGEIEAVLCERSDITHAVVLMREDLTGDQRLVAYLVPMGTNKPDAIALQNFLKGKLPGYMIPSAFVYLDALPLSPSGKIDRKALTPPEDTRHMEEESFVPPYTPVERALAGIMGQVLGINQVGLYASFFDLGGHSLDAMRFIAQVRDVFQVNLPLREIFEAPTIAEFAETLVRVSGEPQRIERTAQLMLDVIDLSESEAQKMLQAKTSSFDFNVG